VFFTVKQHLPLPADTKEAFTNIYIHNIDDNGRQQTPTPNVTQRKSSMFGT